MVCFTPVGKVVVHGELSHPANMSRIYSFFFFFLTAGEEGFVFVDSWALYFLCPVSGICGTEEESG